MLIRKQGKKKIEWPKKIIHVDMDAFYAAVEQRDRPEYRGKPVIIGGDPFGRGVVSTASYEARKFGVHSAMPSSQARRLCPQGIFLRPHFEKYHAVSESVMAILRQHTDLVEPVSLDEAYLDVTRHRFGLEDPVMIASLIKQNIHAVTHLSASAGVAPNCFLAKVASDFKKPDGLTVIYPDQVQDFLANLPVRKIPGVGPVTEEALHKLKIDTCGDLAGVSLAELCRHFGKTGIFLHDRARGQDEREVEPDTPAKQYSSEETFPSDVLDIGLLKSKLREFAGDIFRGLKERAQMGRTVVLKLKYFDFKQITRSQTLKHFPENAAALSEVAFDLLVKKTEAGGKPVRLIGLGVSGLEDTAAKPKLRERDLFG